MTAWRPFAHIVNQYPTTTATDANNNDATKYQCSIHNDIHASFDIPLCLLKNDLPDIAFVTIHKDLPADNSF